jgi:ascorbate-specific PTS system EIIC-type component UlaA
VAVLGAGGFAAALILAALTGLLTPIGLPPAYLAFLLTMEEQLR